ncbi:MAG TPA: hypothetical protein PLR60_06950 [Syntrophorhabdaceae bacterium]|nr:hypothetical protein [Syntrophorhabdaceae bacterium]
MGFTHILIISFFCVLPLAVGAILAAKFLARHRASREPLIAAGPMENPFLLDDWDLR